ncbi:hypothetical protein KIPE111705_24280 [Kibdelosporangium persicum]|uniref:hypothetical protein n=1 Tax=Kibdelosporangium persicum TaxID=2698649 RepID=UPI0015630EAD|nr:hypothetical protein [Kibdelosporangium persicum]
MTDFTKHSPDDSELRELVAAQAPRLFAAVATKHDETSVVGWGMEFEDSAYMVSADGRNQYFLAEAENALKYVRSEPETTHDLVWVVPGTNGRVEDACQPKE